MNRHRHRHRHHRVNTAAMVFDMGTGEGTDMVINTIAARDHRHGGSGRMSGRNEAIPVP
jgi:hypothetical protein